MKTATIPSLRVSPNLRDAATSVLQEGETLSSFVEQSIRENIKRLEMTSNDSTLFCWNETFKPLKMPWSPSTKASN